ncbi:DUF3995 domain-containing protein [Pontibacter sp. G13]|uniref:DUF3995 domain-containing protein n=1 Tax=Pontibacter sp. G13 TaxID=3074898 RepID=UPI00288AE534|nr:DUF3995 domain-containing protein [Pontibacter sp. G13]WNJ17044.1 DUF3995 domain-containing protein [Pontibacter sp. G13]
MMISMLLALTFFVLAAVHYHWAFGGTFGFDAAIPTRENGEKLMNPGWKECVIVGLGLTAFGLFYVLRSGFFSYQLPKGIQLIAGWGIPLIFLLRAVGEFRYVGFFKRLKTTPFAKWDTMLFSPLCLVLGFLGLVLQIAR